MLCLFKVFKLDSFRLLLSLHNVEKSTSKGSTRSIIAEFKADTLLALGFSREAALSSDVDVRLEEIRKDSDNRSSTFKQWIPVQNLFLVRRRGKIMCI